MTILSRCQRKMTKMRYPDWCKTRPCTKTEPLYEKICVIITDISLSVIFSNMINVGAMDSHNLEHQEYTDRIKLYSQRLQQQWNNVQHPSVVTKGL